MKKSEIEKSIMRAVNEAPSLDFEKLASMPVERMCEHDYITRQQEVARPHLRKLTAAACSLVVLICISFWIFMCRMPNSIISVDAQHSIEIVTNRQNKVIGVRTFSKESEEMIEGLDLMNKDFILAVDDILSSMVKLGFLKNGNISLMLSVESENIQKAGYMLHTLSGTALEGLYSQGLRPEIFTQLFEKNTDNSEAAKKYSISVGKMNLINNILRTDLKHSYSAETLSRMSMEELMKIYFRDPVSEISKQSGSTDAGSTADPVKAKENSQSEPISFSENPVSKNIEESKDHETYIPVKKDDLTPPQKDDKPETGYEAEEEESTGTEAEVVPSDETSNDNSYEYVAEENTQTDYANNPDDGEPSGSIVPEEDSDEKSASKSNKADKENPSADKKNNGNSGSSNSGNNSGSKSSSNGNNGGKNTDKSNVKSNNKKVETI
ncbi:MAG: hypothetical protein AAGU76_15505 [Sedimentibacter sp.]|uniref:anti-sigma-I factor RsgI family protein n=1 Tax=Sedimentibacter sp. TaxID=1960295 RepID=UPI003158EF8E